MKDAAAELNGAKALTEWFGEWPTFHDAEVISVFLARTGQSVVQVYPYYPQKPAAVNFIFEEVLDIQLCDFSCQNVVSSLAVERIPDETGGGFYRVNLASSYGLSGHIDAKALRVELLRGRSPDGVSGW